MYINRNRIKTTFICASICCAFPLSSMLPKEPELIRAAETGNIESVERCIQHHHDIDVPNSDHNTHLMEFLMLGDTDIAWRLIDEGADLSAKDRGGNTCLHKAIEGKQTDIAEYIITYKKCDIQSPNKGGYTPLHEAIQQGLTHIAGQLIDQGFNIDTFYHRKQETHLMIALKYGHTGTAWRLIDKGADLSAKDEDEDTCLHKAIEGGKTDIAKHIITHEKCDMQHHNYFGKTPLHKAIEKGLTHIADQLIDQEVKIDTFDRAGQETPLMIALKYGHTDIAWRLIKKGADLRAKDRVKNSCLDKAIKGRQADIAEHIITYKKCETQRPNTLGETSLHFAAKEGLTKIADQLIDQGVNIDTFTRLNEETPLMIALIYGHADIAWRLIKKGADLSVKDDFGNSCPHGATMGGCESIIRYMITHGMHESNVNKDGDTPLDIALRFGRYTIAHKLIKHNGKFSELIKCEMGTNVLPSVNVHNDYNIAYYLACVAARLPSKFRGMLPEAFAHVAFEYMSSDNSVDIHPLVKQLMSTLHICEKSRRRIWDIAQVYRILHKPHKLSNPKHPQNAGTEYIPAELVRRVFSYLETNDMCFKGENYIKFRSLCFDTLFSHML